MNNSQINIQTPTISVNVHRNDHKSKSNLNGGSNDQNQWLYDRLQLVTYQDEIELRRRLFKEIEVNK